MAEETDKSLQPTEEEPLFDLSLKKKKKKKAVAFDEIETEETVERVPFEPTTSQDVINPTSILKPTEETPISTGDLDFSDLKRKKKKKTINLEMDEDTITGEGIEMEKGGRLTNEDEMNSEEFADLKKKKKNKKKAFDLEAFERELAEVENATPLSGRSSTTPGGGEDDEMEGEEGNPDGLFDENDQGLGTKTKTQLAAEKKAWLKEPDRDYTYDELLGRFYQALYLSHPSLSGGGVKKRYTLAPPSVHREGNKRSIWANVAEICKKMHRQPEHVIQFLFAELGTSGSVDGSGNLVIKGRFQQKQIEAVLRRYIVEYVTCKTCKSPDTLLEKDNRLYFVTCESCGSKRSVSAIKTGFSAQIGKRKSQRTG
ncbi:eukaryotic translation initiation factor 2 subunit beta [Melampsora americana]|nr:eukaryotic translation initiation factor 2 subunit beta [Melampsora americana]